MKLINVDASHINIDKGMQGTMRIKQIIPVMCVITLLLAGCGKEEEIFYNATTVTTTKDRVEDTDYVGETAYDGAELEPVLYDVAFSRSSQYLSNIELLEKVDSDEIMQYITNASYTLKTLYGNTYTSILEDQNSFLKTVEDVSGTSFYVDYDAEESDISTYETKLMEAYVDNELELSAVFDTDKSLLYQDSHIYYLRGCLTITQYSGDSSAFTDLFGIMVDKGQPVKIMCEVGFLPHQPNQIVSIELLAYITDTEGPKETATS